LKKTKEVNLSWIIIWKGASFLSSIWTDSICSSHVLAYISVEELKYLVLDIGKKYDLIKFTLTKLSRIIIECMIYMNLSIKREDPTNFNTFVRNLIWFDIKQTILFEITSY